MRTKRLLLVSSLVVLFAGCFVRSRPYTTATSDRRCRSAQHWERDRCVDNRRDDHDRKRDRDRDRDHDHH